MLDMNSECIKLSENFIYSLIYQMVAVAAPFITAPYISRVLGVNAIGDYSYTQSIVAYFTLIATLGSGVHGRRGIAGRVNDSEKLSIFFWEIVVLRFITVCISILGYLTMICTLKTSCIHLFFIEILDIIAVGLDISWFYQGIENFKKTAFRQILIKVLGIIFTISLVKSPKDILIYALCYSVPTLIGNIMLWIGLNDNLVKIKWNKLKPLRNLKMEILLFIPFVASILYSCVDKTMLRWFTESSIENGYYEQALKFIYIGTSITTALTSVVIPKIAFNYQSENFKSLNSYICNGIKSVCLLSAFIGGGIFVIGSAMIPWFYGEGYEKSVFLLKILCFVMFFKGINDFLGTAILVPTFHQNRYSIAIWISTMFNIVLNMIMIPVWKAFGACIASVISEVVLFIVLGIYSDAYIHFKEVSRYLFQYMKPALVGSMASGFISYIMPSTVVGTIMIGMIYMFLFSLYLYVFKDKHFIDLQRKIKLLLKK